MSRNPTRRQALTAGAVSAGMFIGTACNSPRNEQNEQVEKPQGQSVKGPGREAFWGPGPNKNLVRDLTPGQTTVRLAASLRYREGQSIGEEVKRLRDAGMSACIAGVDPWHSMQDSVVRELKAALNQHDIVIFEVGGYQCCIKNPY